jgi:hypothetical protein
MGRAAGCPARFGGLAGGRRGPLPDPMACCGAPGCEGVCAAGAPGPAGRSGCAGRKGAGILGTGLLGITEPGRGAIGADGECRGAAWPSAGVPSPDGSGCRGPVRIWPGLGAGGAGREGIKVPRGVPGETRGGTIGAPVASGGRIGAAGRTGAEGASTRCSIGVVSTGASVTGALGGSITGRSSAGASVTAMDEPCSSLLVSGACSR